MNKYPESGTVRPKRGWGLPNVRDYFRELFARAPEAWRRGSLIMSIVIWLIVIVALWYGYSLEKYPTSVFLAGVTAWTLFELAIVLPFQLFKSQKAKIAELEEKLSGKMDWRGDPVHLCWRTSVDGKQRVFFCVGLYNDSGVTLRNVVLEFDRMVSEGEIPRLRRRLKLRDQSNYEMDLKPGKTGYWVLAGYTLDESDARLELLVEDRLPEDSLPLGSHKIKVKAYAENSKAINRFVNIKAFPDQYGCDGNNVVITSA